MSRTRRSFTTEYKVEAAHRVIDSGRTIAEVARELGLNEALLGRWVADQRRRVEAAAARNEVPDGLPTMGDWANHLSTLFPDVRLKRFLEMRGADGGPWRRICALPAFWVGLLYDDEALDAAETLTADWSY